MTSFVKIIPVLLEREWDENSKKVNARLFNKGQRKLISDRSRQITENELFNVIIYFFVSQHHQKIWGSLGMSRTLCRLVACGLKIFGWTIWDVFHPNLALSWQRRGSWVQTPTRKIRIADVERMITYTCSESALRSTRSLGKKSHMIPPTYMNAPFSSTTTVSSVKYCSFIHLALSTNPDIWTLRCCSTV